MTLTEIIPAIQQLSTSEKLELIQVLAAEIESTEVSTLPTQPASVSWQFLISRPHPWRQQLYIKGRKLLASTLWQDTIANDMSTEQAAENWNLPLAAVHEAIQYCETHQGLIKLEAEEERYRLQQNGVLLEPNSAT
ncbi:MAG: hypothetical protein ACFB5Z_13860 [Elainellaceae cyanobacterium]